MNWQQKRDAIFRHIFGMEEETTATPAAPAAPVTPAAPATAPAAAPAAAPLGPDILYIHTCDCGNGNVSTDHKCRTCGAEGSRVGARASGKVVCQVTGYNIWQRTHGPGSGLEAPILMYQKIFRHIDHSTFEMEWYYKNYGISFRGVGDPSRLDWNALVREYCRKIT